MIAHAPPVILDAAHRYVNLGFSILPCIGKKAAIAWTALCERRPTHADVNRWRDMGLLKNIGIIGGAVSGNLVIVDLDGDEAVGRFSDQFPGLMDTYTVQSGSGHGLHVYLRAQMLPRTKRTVGLEWGNVEMRTDGSYVVAPPSIHPDSGLQYVVCNRVPIKQVMSLTLLSNWIDGQNATKRAPTAHEPQPAIGEMSRWAEAALRAECAAVRLSLHGARNHTLNRAAYKMGQLVGAGRLTRADVERLLLASAHQLVADDGEEAVLRTIASGLDAGILNPRG